MKEVEELRSKARAILRDIAKRGGDRNVNAVINAGNERFIDVSWDEAIEAMLTFALAQQPLEPTRAEPLS